MSTTKTKGTTAKIKELKGDKPTSITTEDLTKLQSTVRAIDKLTGDIGRIETQKYAMLVGMQSIQGEIDTMRIDFTDKYGSDNINIQTGEIAQPEETTENVEVNS